MSERIVGHLKVRASHTLRTRSSYADLLREDRGYTIRYRMFSGTQRILLWNDPLWAAAYSRSFGFCGSNGMDLMEPLTCRGRRGSAQPGRRDGYIDAKLAPRWDWQKYEGWYRTWGRLSYNPNGGNEVCSIFRKQRSTTSLLARGRVPWTGADPGSRSASAARRDRAETSIWRA